LADKERGLGAMELIADDDALELIAGYSSGDCRNAYNTLEVAAQLAVADGSKHITKSVATEAAQKRVLMYDKAGEEHYNLISALHKSVRNSDPDAALYWLGRMFAGGEDPLYLARRIVRMAVEDIGLAAPEALHLCLSAKETYDFLGSPEGDLALAEAVVYLALAPKSNAVYTAFGAVQDDIEHTRQEPVPLHLRNAPTKLMKDLGYAEGYRYAHDEEDKVADMDCLPESLKAAATTTRRRRAAKSSWRSGLKKSNESGKESARRNADRHASQGFTTDFAMSSKCFVLRVARIACEARTIPAIIVSRDSRGRPLILLAASSAAC
jgi:putative ATPase